MSIGEFLELFFVIAAAIAMPFIVIGSCFNFIFPKERTKPLTIFFLIISIIYALLYSYFSLRSLTRDNGSWKRIMGEKKKKTEEEKKENK